LSIHVVGGAMFIYQSSGQAFHIGLDRLYNCFSKAFGVLFEGRRTC